MRTDPDRRTLLGALAGIGASTLAGCLGGGGTDGSNGGPTETTSGSTSTTEGGSGGNGGNGGNGSSGNESGNGGTASYGGFLDGVGNFDGVVDETGSETVTVEVGVEQGGGPFGFGPPAVKVSQGTTVTWKWVDGKNSHNVQATGGTYGFQSEYASEVGYTFEHTFERTGVAKYVCVPHESLGMKGVVEVV